MPMQYFAEVIDLDIVAEPMIADPDVNNADVSKRYTHTIPAFFYGRKKSRSWFCGSCMVHKGDLKILSQKKI
jgi:aconitate hydratase 2/2-methylisocitrate dehydratase